MTIPQDYISFNTLICNYRKLQKNLLCAVRALGSRQSSSNPAQFILLQFKMSQVTQVGESISNMIAQLNSLINRAIANQKPQ